MGVFHELITLLYNKLTKTQQIILGAFLVLLLLLLCYSLGKGVGKAIFYLVQ